MIKSNVSTSNHSPPPTHLDSSSSSSRRPRLASVSSPDLRDSGQSAADTSDSISNDMSSLSISAKSQSPSMFNYHEYLVNYYNTRGAMPNDMAHHLDDENPKMASRVNRSKFRLYSKLPWRRMSRAWGKINSMDLPVWCRKPCYNIYSKMFNCNLNEMDNQDLRQYKNLSEFFRRGLKPNARTVDNYSCLISPCDGKILHFGQVTRGYLEQVKGVNYSLRAFLGKQSWPKTNAALHHKLMADNKCESVSNMHMTQDQIKDESHRYEEGLLHNPANKLFHCVIYLAPGDYHRFHSPTDWTVTYRRHFPGELFSVNPSVARWLQGLFNMNERVVYYGHWRYGFFSMTPVGATNVGSIRVYMDEKLTTNNKEPKKNLSQSFDRSFCATNASEGQHVQRGQSFGEFNLGSTIVLIFEAPENFQFDIKQNDKVFFGQKLGSAIRSAYL